MVNTLVIAQFVAIFFTGYLVRKEGVLHPLFSLTPEFLAGIAFLLFIARAISGKRVTLDGRYVLFFSALLLVLVAGVVVQMVPSGAVAMGLRSYLKFLPFFLLPAVYSFSRRELKVQFGVLAVLMLFQVPLAFYQRFIQYAHRMHTGDPITGTATTSSALSLLLVCSIAVLVVLYLRKKINLLVLLGASALLFAPATINETKATLALLPIAVLAPFFFMPRGSRRIGRLLPVAAMLGLGVFAFIQVYDHLIQYRRYGSPISSFVTERAGGYLYTGAAEGADRGVGRLDSVVIAARELSKDPVDLALGLGAGNVSQSSIAGFAGRYARYEGLYGVTLTQISNLLWEIGVLGFGTYLLFYWFVFRDSAYLARTEDPSATVGQMWTTVVVIMTFALAYKSVFAMNEIGYLFWFYSGVVASKALEARRRVRARSSAAMRRAGAPATGAPVGALQARSAR